MNNGRNGSSLFPALPKFFDDFFSRDLNNWAFDNFSSQGTTLPAVNVKETADSYVVEMAAPGMNRDDFRIELDNDVLRITGERKSEQEHEEERYARREFQYQSFQRTFRLSKQVVDDSRIHAKYENGVLRILVPKKEEAKALPPRTIEVG